MAKVEVDPRDIALGGGVCPVCCDDEHEATIGSMFPLAVLGGNIQAHEFGVCETCHEDQFLAYYGYPISERYDPAHRPARVFSA